MRQTVAPAMAKWGIAGNDFKVIAGVGAPTTSYGIEWQFRRATSSAAFTGALSPQRIIVPSKDIVNTKVYINHLCGNSGASPYKVGWLMMMTETLEDGELNWGTVPITGSYPATVAELKSVYPYSQFALGYETLPAGTATWTMHRTQLHLLKEDNGSIVADPVYSFEDFSETVGGKYVYIMLQLYRLAGWTAGTAVIADGLYDVDGDGSIDSDTLQNANGIPAFVGMLAEFL